MGASCAKATGRSARLIKKAAIDLPMKRLKLMPRLLPLEERASATAMDIAVAVEASPREELVLVPGSSPAEAVLQGVSPWHVAQFSTTGGCSKAKGPLFSA